MANRAERRARARQGHSGASPRPMNPAARARAGVLDEYSLQEQSRRLEDREDGEWKPSGRPSQEGTQERAVAVRHSHMPHGVRGWLRMISWTLLVLSIIGFFIVMWVKNAPLWLVIVIACVFALGVLLLGLTAGSPRENPSLDENGTAV